MSAAPLLQLRGVHTHIGLYHILHGVDLCIPAGELTMLLGRNGAGKTTTLRTIMGLWKPSAGQVTLRGQPIGGLGTPRIAAMKVGYVPENMGIFSDLTVAENMRLAARKGPLAPARLERIFAAFPALNKFWHQRAGVLSGGQKQMLAIARAIAEPKDLLLVDEPTKGLAPAIVDNMVAVFEQLKAEGTTIVMVEQNLLVAQRLGDSVAVMDDGRIVHWGPMAELADNQALQVRLLGLSLADGAH